MTQPRGLVEDRENMHRMGAVALWVRSVLRRNRGASVFLIALIGLPAGLVAGAFEANQRAAGSLDRFLARTHTWDAAMEICPADTFAKVANADAPTVRVVCYSEAVGRRAQAMLAGVPEVEATALSDPFPFAVLDPSAANGWGWSMNGTYAFRTPGVPIALDGGVLHAGRWPADDAPDEIAVDETMAKGLNLHVGDTIRMAGWSADLIDLHDRRRPNTVPFTSTIVGIVRSASDIVQLELLGPLQSDHSKSGRFLAGAGWAAAHLDSFGRWTTSTVVRLRSGQADVPALQSAIDKAGWVGAVSRPIGDVAPVVRGVIRDERDATAAFAWIGLVATALLGALVVRRQLRNELNDRSTLEALGFDRRATRAATILRALSIAIPAALLGLLVLTLGTALTPFGTAGRIDAGGLRVAPIIGALMVLAILLLVGIAATAAPRSSARPSAARPPRRRALSAGPSTLFGASLTRGAGPAVAGAASAVAVAALLGGGVAVASFDHARSTPATYGAWFDASINLFFTIGKPDENAAMVRSAGRVQGVRAVTVVHSLLSAGTIGDAALEVMSLDHRVGVQPRLALRSGRSARRADEIVIDMRTADALHKHVGDRVTLTIDAKPSDHRIVGIAYPFDLCSCGSTGLAIVHPSAAPGSFASDVVALRFAPGTSQAQVVERLRGQFGTFSTVPLPPISLTHVGAVRTVPRLIAALVGALAFATLLQALVSLLRGHRRDFAVLSTLGFERRQHLATRTWTALLLTLTGTMVGIPLGIVVGRRLWRVYTDRLALVPAARIPLSAILTAPILAIALAIVVGALSGRSRDARSSLAAALQTE